MTDHSSTIAALKRWIETDGAGASREAVRQLLLDCGYEEQQAKDYPSMVSLFYRDWWPRYMLRRDKQSVPVATLVRIASSLIPLLEKKGRQR